MKTFHGGIHPGDHKEATNKKEIVNLTPPSELIFPLSQHIGAPATAVVKAGDKVEVGQLIASVPQEALGVNIHASVNGRVADVTEKFITIEAE